MVWQCRLIEYQRQTNGKTLQVGDMFFAPTLEEVEADDALPLEQQKGLWWPYSYCKPHKLSPFYHQVNKDRRPLLIFLPNRILWCVDSKQFRDNRYLDKGWVVRGDAPNITIFPSIDITGHYHGFINNGVIQDDVGGLLYDANGRLLT